MAKLITSLEAAERYGVPRSTIRGWVQHSARTGVRSHGVNAARCTLLDPREINRWLDTGRAVVARRPSCERAGCRRWQRPGFTTCGDHAGRVD